MAPYFDFHGSPPIAGASRLTLEQLVPALADRYRIERTLGAGGMATVYLVHDLRHDRPVALRVIHQDLGFALGPERFLLEIKLAARLQHANINPRSAGALRVVAMQLTLFKRPEEAIPITNRALALDSTLQFVHIMKVVALLQQGDRNGARAAYAVAERQVGPSQLPTLPSLPVFPIGITWVLDSAQHARWLASVQGPVAMVANGPLNDRIADYYWRLGNVDRARAYADTMRGALEAALKKSSSNANVIRARLGLMQAFLGHKDEAIQNGLAAVAGLPVARDGWSGMFAKYQLMRISLATGKAEKAIDQLEELLQMPGFLTAVWLRTDPTYESLKGNPRFDRLASS